VNDYVESKGMRSLLLMRHAKSDWSIPELSDHDRPLNKRGQQAAPKMARHLVAQGISVDVILASSACRVQQTVSLMQQIWCGDAEVITERSLYLATPDEIAANIQSLHDSWQAAMVVGHNPGMLALVNYLAQSSLDMPTAAIALFTSDANSWKHCMTSQRWQLTNYWKPKTLSDV
jgi:phosphohistidine phosphatase